MINTRVNVAIVGAGYWGPNLIRNFNGIEMCRVIWVCDPKEGRRGYVQARFPGIPVTGNLDQVLSDDEVDAVVIATPVSSHHSIAMEALEAGKHVWVEKPLAHTSSEARDMVTVAAVKGLVLATDHLFVYNPGISRAKEIISRGGIGELCYAESGRVNLGPPASEVDVLWDLATHDLAITYYLWGRKPVQVVAHGHRFKHPQLIDVAFIHLQFEDGGTAVHHVSWLSPHKTRRYFVAGRKGSMIFDDMQPERKLCFIDEGIDSRIGAKDDDIREFFYKPGEVIYPELEKAEPLKAACEDFVYCIRNGGKMQADGEAGLAVVQMLEAIEHSIAEGSKAVKLL